MKNYKLAWRNLWRNRRRTMITVASIFFAVFFALIFRSVQTGSYDYMYKNSIESYSGYIQIQNKVWWDEKTIDNAFELTEDLEEKLLSHNNVEALIPRVEYFSLASSGSNTKGAMILGVDPEKEAKLSNIYGKKVKYVISEEAIQKIKNDKTFSDKLKKNAELYKGGSFTNDDRLINDLGIKKENVEKYLPLLKEYTGINCEDIRLGEPGVWLGAKLAQFLELNVGDTLVLLGQGYHGSTSAGKYEVKGLMRYPIPEINSRVVYLPFDIAQELFHVDNLLTSVVLDLKNNSDRAIEKTMKAFASDLPSGIKAMDWKEMNEVVVQQMEADNESGKLMIAILYLVIFFGLFGTVLMMTAERRREFGVLVAIGMQKKKLASIISWEMFYMGLLGIIVGCIVCMPLITYAHYNPMEFRGEIAHMMEEYDFEPKLVFEHINFYFIWQGVIVGIMVLVSLFYPLRKIFRLQVVNALKA